MIKQIIPNTGIYQKTYRNAIAVPIIGKRKRVLKETIYEPVGEALVSLSKIIDNAIKMAGKKIYCLKSHPIYINTRGKAYMLVEKLSENEKADIERVENYKRIYRGLVGSFENAIEKTSSYMHNVGKKRYDPNDSYVSKTASFLTSNRR